MAKNKCIDEDKAKKIWMRIFKKFQKEHKRKPTKEEMLKLWSGELNIIPYKNKLPPIEPTREKMIRRLLQERGDKPISTFFNKWTLRDIFNLYKKTREQLMKDRRENILKALMDEDEDFEIKDITEVKTKGEAQQIAISYQNWASEKSLSLGELGEYAEYFRTLGKKFGLIKEFKENGIL